MSREDKNKTLQIVCWYITTSSSGKAFLAEFRDSDGDKLGQRWLPTSRVKQVVRGAGGFTVSANRGEEIVIELPMWLAEKDDIEPLIREQLLEMEGEDLEEDEDEEYDDDIPF